MHATIPPPPFSRFWQGTCVCNRGSSGVTGDPIREFAASPLHLFTTTVGSECGEGIAMWTLALHLHGRSSSSFEAFVPAMGAWRLVLTRDT